MEKAILLWHGNTYEEILMLLKEGRFFHKLSDKSFTEFKIFLKQTNFSDDRLNEIEAARRQYIQKLAEAKIIAKMQAERLAMAQKYSQEGNFIAAKESYDLYLEYIIRREGTELTDDYIDTITEISEEYFNAVCNFFHSLF